jgi:hypothetical protein
MSYTDLFRALNAAGVKYLITGGFAVNLYGYVRLTVDLDLALALGEANLKAALAVLADLGYRPSVPVPAADLADPAKRREWIEGKGALVFTFVQPDQPHHHVDVFLQLPFDFETAWQARTNIEVGDVALPVVGIDTLIALKRIAGRPRDLSDVEQLERIAAMKKSGRIP